MIRLLVFVALSGCATSSPSPDPAVTAITSSLCVLEDGVWSGCGDTGDGGPGGSGGITSCAGDACIRDGDCCIDASRCNLTTFVCERSLPPP